MMDCTQARDEFAALLDGELNPDERLAVESHLSQCSDCLRELDGFKRVDGLYRDLPSYTAPSDFEARVRERLRPRVLGLGRGASRRVLWPALAVAACLLLVVGSVVVHNVQTGAIWQAKTSGTAAESAMQDVAVTAGARSDKLMSPAPPEAATMQAEMPQRRSEELSAASEPMAAPPPPSTADQGAFAETPKEEILGGSAPMAFDRQEAPKAYPGTDNRISATGEADSMAGGGASSRGGNMGMAIKAQESAAPAPVALETAPAPEPPASPKQSEKVSSSESAGGSTPSDDADYFYLETPASLDAPVAAAPAPSAVPETAGSSVAAIPMVEQRSRLNVQPDTLAPQPAQGQMASRATAAPPAAMDAKTAASSKESAPGDATKNVAGREFRFKDGVWVQSTYDGQETVKIARGGQSAATLLQAHADLGAVLTLGDRVIFKAGRKWYEIQPAATP